MSLTMPMVLDCTLRDGGYYTNWDFDRDLVDIYLSAMAGGPIQFVEIGYRSPPKQGYLGEYFYLSRRTAEFCKDRLRADQKLAVMLNEKDVSPDQVDALLADLVGIVDLVRFAVAPTALAGARELAAACRALGFEVGVNVMYLDTYVHDVSPLATLEGSAVDYVSLVDSYGGCRPREVGAATADATRILDQPIGFHGHDNISLAFANALTAIENGAQIVDATVQGMGRGAGNLATETIATWLALEHGAPIDFGAMSQASAAFGAMKARHGWGTNLAYLISGFAGLPQAEVMNWFGTRRYQLDSIVQALHQQGGGEVDHAELPGIGTIDAGFSGRPAIVLGGGESVREHRDAIARLIAGKDATLVHSSSRNIGLFEDIAGSQIYCLAGQEWRRANAAMRSIMTRRNAVIVVPPPPRFRDSHPDRGTVVQIGANWGSPADARLGPITDEAPLDLAFAAVEEIKAGQVYLAGFDGYATASVADQHNAADVQKAIDHSKQSWENPPISITPTLYDVAQSSVYALLS